MRAAVAVAVGFALLAAGLVVLLSRSEPRLAGTNSRVVASRVDIPIQRGQRYCQSNETIPAGTHAVRLYTSLRGARRGRLEVSFTAAAGRLIARTARSVGDRPSELPLPARIREAAPVRACFRNLGPGQIRLAGNLTPLFEAGRPRPVAPRERLPDVVRIDYLRRGRESWWHLAPVVARRFGLFKAPVHGSVLMWLVLGATGLVWTGAVILLLRAVPR
jgi:hypothetical protein